MNERVSCVCAFMWRTVSGVKVPVYATDVLCAKTPEENSGWAVMGLAFMVYGLWFRASCFGFQVSGFGFRVPGSEFRIQGSGFRVEGSGFRIQGLGLGVLCFVLEY